MSHCNKRPKEEEEEEEKAEAQALRIILIQTPLKQTRLSTTHYKHLERKQMAASTTLGVFSTRISFPKPESSSNRLSLKTNINAVSELGFVASQLTGLKISDDVSFQAPPKPISTKFSPALQPVARTVFPLFSPLKIKKFSGFCFLLTVCFV